MKLKYCNIIILMLMLIPSVMADIYQTNVTYTLSNTTLHLQTESGSLDVGVPAQGSISSGITINIDRVNTTLCQGTQINSSGWELVNDSFNSLSLNIVQIKNDVNNMKNNTERGFQLYSDCYTNLTKTRTENEVYVRDYIENAQCDSKVSSKQSTISSLNDQLTTLNTQITTLTTERDDAKSKYLLYFGAGVAICVIGYLIWNNKKKGKTPFKTQSDE